MRFFVFLGRFLNKMPKKRQCQCELQFENHLSIDMELGKLAQPSLRSWRGSESSCAHPTCSFFCNLNGVRVITLPKYSYILTSPGYTQAVAPVPELLLQALGGKVLPEQVAGYHLRTFGHASSFAKKH